MTDECVICFEDTIKNYSICKTKQCVSCNIVCETCMNVIVKKNKCPFCTIEYKYNEFIVVNHPIPKIQLAETEEQYMEDIAFGHIIWKWVLKSDGKFLGMHVRPHTHLLSKKLKLTIVLATRIFGPTNWGIESNGDVCEDWGWSCMIPCNIHKNDDVGIYDVHDMIPEIKIEYL